MSTVKEDFRNLAYTLCEGRGVPLLVTDIIAECLVDRDLFNINILSRSLNVQANASIYRDVVLNLDGSEQSIKTASLLFRTLLTSETATRAVRTLSLAGDPLQDWRNKFSRVQDSESIEDPLRSKIPPGIYADLTDFTQGEIELYDKVAASSSASMRPPTIEVWALYLHVLRLAPHVQDFSVSSDYFRIPDFRSALHDMARGSSMQRLRSCSLCLDLLEGNHRHPIAVRDWDTSLLMLFAAPGIRSIAAVVSLKPEAVRQLQPGGSSITRLTLHHYQIQACDLSSLLATTPSLRYLKYHATTDYAWSGARCRKKEISEHGVGLEPLYDALHHVSDSLQELHTSQDFDEDSIHFCSNYAMEQEPPFRPRGELSTLKRLHALTVPYATLLGGIRKDCVWDWHTILPSSLHRIVLTDNLQEISHPDCWTDGDLMPVFSGLVERLSATQRGNEAAEFGLHLAIVDSDFNEPAREELTRICEARGARCLIEKARADRHKSPVVRMSRGRGRGHLSRGRG